MRMMVHWISVIVMLLTVSSAMAGDINAGEYKAVLCVACHGHNGISINNNWPNLAGQKEAYMINQLKDFRDGRRSGAVMPESTQSLSDEDIENLAAFYSSLDPCGH